MSERGSRAFAAAVAAAVCVLGGPGPAAAAAPPARAGAGLAAEGAVVSGTVSLAPTPFREDVALPGMATVDVELFDLSAANPRAAALGKDSVWIAAGRLPVSFRIACDASRVDPTHVYVVRARIRDGGKALYVSAAPYYVLTRGAPGRVDIVVVPAGGR